MAEQFPIVFRGKTYYADAPELTPLQIDNLLGAARTPGTRLILVRGTSAKPVVGRVVISDSGTTRLEEIPLSTQKGGLFDQVKRWLNGSDPDAMVLVPTPPVAPPAPVRVPAPPQVPAPLVARAPVAAAPARAPVASAPASSASQRDIYVKAQVASIAEVYGERYGSPVQLDSALSYLFLPRFPLPRRWGERETPLLIHIPPDYPATPPNGFFLSARCHGPHVFSGGAFAGLHVHGGSASISVPGWNWFCVHCQNGWTPGSSPLEPMNLWTYLRVIQTALSVNEF